MAANAPNPAQALRDAQDRFVGAWGQMAGAWGITRTQAEVHALLYVSGDSLCTDDVMERLQISRGNASMSLRALVEWGIIAKVTRRGDRKEYFEAEQDVWALFRAIVRERMNREVDPLLANLLEIRDMTSRHEGGKDRDMPGATPDEAARIRAHNARIDEMTEFFGILTQFSSRFVSPSGKGLRLAATILNKMPDLPGTRSKRHPARGADA